MKKFAITRKDGGVSIIDLIEPTKNESYKFPTIEEVTKKWHPRLQAEILSWREINEHEIPKDRTFRDAWKDTGKIEVEMNKAREIQMNKIREIRNERLTELDKKKYGPEFDIERQALRDIPQKFDLSTAKNPEELKILFPEILKPHMKEN